MSKLKPYLTIKNITTTLLLLALIYLSSDILIRRLLLDRITTVVTPTFVYMLLAANTIAIISIAKGSGDKGVR